MHSNLIYIINGLSKVKLLNVHSRLNMVMAAASYSSEPSAPQVRENFHPFYPAVAIVFSPSGLALPLVSQLVAVKHLSFHTSLAEMGFQRVHQHLSCQLLMESHKENCQLAYCTVWPLFW